MARDARLVGHLLAAHGRLDAVGADQRDAAVHAALAVVHRQESTAALDLNDLPGFYIRRRHQIAVAIFLQETGTRGLTPVPYAAPSRVGLTPGVDQCTLARSIGLDTSTTAGVVDRLEMRGLMQRKASPQDRRVRLLSLTDDGQDVQQAVEPDMLKAQRRIPKPLPAPERDEFMHMLGKLVTAHNGLSRAPGEP